MMIRTVLITATIAIGITGVVAQTDAISQRKELMKKNSQHTKAVSAMVKGDAPFDAKVVTAAFTQWSDTAAQLPKLFPDNSKSGGETRALPKIWSDRKASMRKSPRSRRRRRPGRRMPKVSRRRSRRSARPAATATRAIAPPRRSRTAFVTNSTPSRSVATAL